jgi:DNA-binding transcriptional LysR family regulator
VSLASIDLNLLLVLDTVLEERSVVRAAERLHVTPSAISNSLARLRTVVGDPLVSRSGRGIVPTPRATTMAPALHRALRELDDVVHGGAFDPATTDRTFTIAMADAVQLVRLPPLAARLAVEMPRARLRALSIDTLLATGGLAGTEVDVVIGAGEGGPGVHEQPLYAERTVLVARAGHPRARARLSKTALGALRHVEVHVAAGRGNRPLAATYAELGIAREVVIVVPTFTAAAAIVAATDYVASLPASLVDVVGPRLGLVRLRPPLPAISVSIRMLWHERTHRDPALRAFRALLASAKPAASR